MQIYNCLAFWIKSNSESKPKKSLIATKKYPAIAIQANGKHPISTRKVSGCHKRSTRPNARLARLSMITLANWKNNTKGVFPSLKRARWTLIRRKMQYLFIWEKTRFKQWLTQFRNLSVFVIRIKLSRIWNTATFRKCQKRGRINQGKEPIVTCLRLKRLWVWTQKGKWLT